MSRERVTRGKIPRRVLRWDRKASQAVGAHYYAIGGVDNSEYITPDPGPWDVRTIRNRSDERHLVKLP